VIGYLHRGVERSRENRTYQQFAPYVDRMDSWPRFQMAWAIVWRSKAAEYGGPAARVARVILTELNRIASHLLWLGTPHSTSAPLRRFHLPRARRSARDLRKLLRRPPHTRTFRIGRLLYELYDGFEKGSEDVLRASFPRG
jgi:NADH-quinone oxidoreductase subunit D